MSLQGAAADVILRAQRTMATRGDENAMDVTTLNVTAHRLQTLIHDRRAMLAARGAMQPTG